MATIPAKPTTAKTPATPTPATPTLADITKAERDAQDAVAKASAIAERARTAAERARAELDAQLVIANRAYLDQLEREHPAAHRAALAEVAPARQALEDAVFDGGDIFGSYLDWIAAETRLWEVDTELAEARILHGKPGRFPNAPAPNFFNDINGLLYRAVLQLQVLATDRIAQRKATILMAGKEKVHP